MIARITYRFHNGFGTVIYEILLCGDLDTVVMDLGEKVVLIAHGYEKLWRSLGDKLHKNNTNIIKYRQRINNNNSRMLETTR